MKLRCISSWRLSCCCGRAGYLASASRNSSSGDAGESVSLIVAALALVVLPFALDFAGLPLRSSIDVVVFAIACMGLNILVGHTGLVSFGHGAWFGLAAYAAALSQRYWFPGAITLPALFAIAFVAVSATLSGALILRRRGVYFSLLTLALTALLFAIAYRWTEFTGGESGLGGVTRGPCSTSISSVTPIIIGWLPRSEWRFSSCSGVFTVRRSAVCSWRSAKTNSAHASLAIQPTATN